MRKRSEIKPTTCKVFAISCLPILPFYFSSAKTHAKVEIIDFINEMKQNAQKKMKC